MQYSMYRRMDLFIFLILMVFSSVVSLFVFTNKSFQFYFSFTVLVLFITLVRWNYLGILPYFISQIIVSIVQIYFFQTEIAITLVANLGSVVFLFVIPLILTKYKKEVRKNPLVLLSLLLLTYVLIGIGEGFSLLFLGDFNFLGNIVFYIFNQEIYSIVISFVLILLLRSIDNLIVNVKNHLKMNQEEGDEQWKVLENDKTQN
ncbi:MAG: hypothetical protein K2N64_03640 [Anaeroplasmataceae bacterium]|nr:hypothetical protein [Anaeroplasmataceae bacterium]